MMRKPLNTKKKGIALMFRYHPSTGVKCSKNTRIALTALMPVRAGYVSLPILMGSCISPNVFKNGDKERPSDRQADCGEGGIKTRARLEACSWFSKPKL